MRLSTLARKVNKTPTQLIVFLNEQEIDVTNGLHTKLEKEAVQIVLDKYLPNQKAKTNIEAERDDSVDVIDLVPDESMEIVQKAIMEEASEVDDVPAPKKAPKIHEVRTEEISIKEEEKAFVEETPKEIKTGTVEDVESGLFKEIEHIKAKKITLEGIKVIGKIDIPEKPKKASEIHESEVSKNEEPADTSSEKEIRSKTKKKPYHKQKEHNILANRSKNRLPLSFDEKLEQEERNKRREKQKKAREEKRRKQKFYQENILPKHIPKTPKKKKKTVSHQSITHKETIVRHKNPIKRLWAWLNGKYDRY